MHTLGTTILKSSPSSWNNSDTENYCWLVSYQFYEVNWLIETTVGEEIVSGFIKM